MEVVIEIQGFRDICGRFLPKEIAIVAIGNAIEDHWILSPPHAFQDLTEKSKRENNWLSRYYHGIEWFDGETNQKYFTSRLREITRHVGNIFTAGSEKARYLENLLSRNIYNLENIAPAFKNIPEEEGEGRLCCFHGFGKFTAYHCAVRNANKLKRWVLMRKSRVCYDNCSDSTRENWESDDDSEVYEKTNLDTSQRQVKEEDHREQENKEECTNIETSPRLNNTRAATDSKVTPEYFVQVVPRIRENEFTRNSTSTETALLQSCWRLRGRQTPEGVDEVDSHHR